MATLNHVLAQRLHQISSSQKRRDFTVSVAGHGLLVFVCLLVPNLWDEPPETFDYVAVTVVPPKALGIDQPPPPEPEPEKKAAPPPPKPKDEPKPEPEPDRPVLVEKKTPKPPPPPPKPAPVKPAVTPAPPADVPKRQGSPFGDPLGASTTEATVGVEDPNFTYGYYLDLIVGRISSQWTRPAVGGEVMNALLYFRIEKDGSVHDLALKRSSGDPSFDQIALLAVRSSSPLPPLPKGYKREFLGINLTFK